MASVFGVPDAGNSRKVQLNNLPNTKLPEKPKHYGRVMLSYGVIQALLPKGSKIVKVDPAHPMYAPDAVQVWVEHDHFPVTEEGCQLPLAIVEVSVDASGFIVSNEFKDIK